MMARPIMVVWVDRHVNIFSVPEYKLYINFEIVEIWARRRTLFHMKLKPFHMKLKLHRRPVS